MLVALMEGYLPTANCSYKTRHDIDKRISASYTSRSVNCSALKKNTVNTESAAGFYGGIKF